MSDRSLEDCCGWNVISSLYYPMLGRWYDEAEEVWAEMQRSGLRQVTTDSVELHRIREAKQSR